MFGSLRPWLNLQSETFYNAQIHSLSPVQSLFGSHYELNVIRPFSNKTQYYQKLIDNDTALYGNELLRETEGATSNLIAYKIDQARRRLHALITNISTIIDTQKFLTREHPALSEHRQQKETTFITSYLLSALIKCSLEIQYHFHDDISGDDLWVVSDFYTRLLQQQPPVSQTVKEIHSHKVSKQADEPMKKTNFDAPAFTYNKLDKAPDNIVNLFNSLKKNQRIAPDTSITEFKHAFSGISPASPISWVGAKSELPYLIKLLCNTQDVLSYSGSIWQTTCACFVDKDGRKYDENNLRSQKKPKQTALVIEKIADLMR